MATLSRIVLGSEVAATITAIEKSHGGEFKYRLFQLDGADKFRIVVHLDGFDSADWKFFGLTEPAKP